MRTFLGVLAAVILITAASTVTAGGGAEQRRLAAILAVIEGDARRLQHEKLDKHEHLAVERRIRGMLSVLGMLFREAGQVPPHGVEALPEQFETENVPALVDMLPSLREMHPLDLRALRPVAYTSQHREVAERLHGTYCAGCHDRPDPLAPLPIYQLKAQAASMPFEEFAARLLTSVRGDSMTSLENPFTDDELAALLGLYYNFQP